MSNIDDITMVDDRPRARRESDTDEIELFLFFFIGRLNPPHPGHIYTLKNLVEFSEDPEKAGFQVKDGRKVKSFPFILLGSGPNNGERTLDNPIDYATKEAFVRDKLREELGSDANFYIYEKHPGGKAERGAKEDIPSLTNKVLNTEGGDLSLSRAEKDQIQKISVIIVSGDKGSGSDSDVGSRFGLVNTATKSLQEFMQGRDIEIALNVKGIEPEKNKGVDLSATQVRQDAYLAIMNNNEDKFIKNPDYIKFYGKDHVSNIYSSIETTVKKIEPSDETLKNYKENKKIEEEEEKQRKQNKQTRKRAQNTEEDSESNKSTRRSTRKKGGGKGSSSGRKRTPKDRRRGRRTTARRR